SPDESTDLDITEPIHYPTLHDYTSREKSASREVYIRPSVARTQRQFKARESCLKQRQRHLQLSQRQQTSWHVAGVGVLSWYLSFSELSLTAWAGWPCATTPVRFLPSR